MPASGGLGLELELRFVALEKQTFRKRKVKRAGFGNTEVAHRSVQCGCNACRGGRFGVVGSHVMKGVLERLSHVTWHPP